MTPIEPWYKFWKPQSGIVGGLITGVLIMSLYLAIFYLIAGRG